MLFVYVVVVCFNVEMKQCSSQVRSVFETKQNCEYTKMNNGNKGACVKVGE